MVKSKNKIFSIALCLILCLAMVLGGIKIASGRNVSAEGDVRFAKAGETFIFNFDSVTFDDFVAAYGEITNGWENVIKTGINGTASWGGLPDFGDFRSRDDCVFRVGGSSGYFGVLIESDDVGEGPYWGCLKDGTVEDLGTGFGWDYKYTFGEDLYVTEKEQTLLNKFMTKDSTLFASAGDTFKFNFDNVSYEDLEGVRLLTFSDVDWKTYDTVTFDGKSYTNAGIYIGYDGEPLITIWLNSYSVLTANYSSDGTIWIGSNDGLFDDLEWEDLDAYGGQYPSNLVSKMTYTFENDFYVNSQEKALLNKLLTKVVDPVEETGIDLYSGLAISGAMLILACGCAVVMSKMKRKQSM
ncbi:MAG: hypothetical protein KBT30_02955 [Clostridiales bacterium]|nr:hypothetical protein [Candidatus Apopatousia equi]